MGSEPYKKRAKISINIHMAKQKSGKNIAMVYSNLTLFSEIC